MSINFHEIAGLLHLRAVSADIYIELLTHGELSKEQLKKLSRKPLMEISKGIEELLERGFIISVNNTSKKKVFQAMSVHQIEQHIEQEKQALQNLKKIVIPQIQQPQKLGIIKYEGLEGIRKVYLEVLEVAKNTGEDILAFESGVDAESIGPVFMENYIRKRIDHKIKAHVITPDMLKDKKYKKEYEGRYTHIKLLPDFHMKANINIVGDLVMSFTLDPPQGTLRRNPDEAQTLKAIFKKLWNTD